MEQTLSACCETAPNALIARHFQILEVHADVRERVRALPLILSIAVLLVAIAGCCYCR